MQEITVTILDLWTGKKHKGRSGLTYFDWSDGAYSCDCNRAVAYDPESHTGLCASCRYIVIAVKGVGDEAKALVGFNYSYQR